MSKKFFVLLLATLFAMFSVSQVFAETAYKLVNASDIEGDLEAELSDDVEPFVGGNFYGVYKIPKIAVASYDNSVDEDEIELISFDVKFDLSWTLSSDKLTDVIIQSVTSDDENYLIELAGVLPDEAPGDDEDGYALSFVAKITGVDDAEYQEALLNLSCDVVADAIDDAEEFDEDKAYTSVAEDAMSSYIADFDTIDLKNVYSSYSVTVPYITFSALNAQHPKAGLLLYIFQSPASRRQHNMSRDIV
ncbi:MAG: hypothetical protein IJ859_05345 [Synergistaceae bacterium]|nr:hypothetical protein [Synergistaceae bacterium]MBR2208219.1 hypothetical protein [Synergistaceae bacterium]